MSTIQSMFEFIDVAVKNRNYAPNTAFGLKAALKLFETSLNEQERGSLEIFKKNFDKIYQDVVRNNQKKFSMGSLNSYRSRVQRVISDYEKYGIDPTKMANWQSNSVTRKRIAQPGLKNDTANRTPAGNQGIGDESPTLLRIPIPLQNGTESIHHIPRGITTQDILRIKKILDSYVEEDEAKGE